jgi:putative ergosteryl-3beta-O-L-aspartate hydrolase
VIVQKSVGQPLLPFVSLEPIASTVYLGWTQESTPSGVLNYIRYLHSASIRVYSWTGRLDVDVTLHESVLKMSVFLYLKVYFVRLLQRWITRKDLRQPPPPAPAPGFKISIPTTSRAKPGTIDLLFYTPALYHDTTSTATDFPIVMNIHGGGFTIGGAHDNGRLASAIMDASPVVFVSVEYGLAPEHPYPIAAGDCVDALRWLWAHAPEYRLNARRTVLAGNSAGGTLATVATMKINLESEYEKLGSIVGLVDIYPGLDKVQTRDAKMAGNPMSAARGGVPKWLYAVFDRSYLGPLGRDGHDLASLELSPGLASDEDLIRGLPQNVAIYSCEYDQLLVENEAFRKRLTGLGKQVGGYMVEGEPHGFDLRYSTGERYEKKVKMYKDAAQNVKKWV